MYPCAIFAFFQLFRLCKDIQIPLFQSLQQAVVECDGQSKDSVLRMESAYHGLALCGHEMTTEGTTFVEFFTEHVARSIVRSPFLTRLEPDPTCQQGELK